MMGGGIHVRPKPWWTQENETLINAAPCPVPCPPAEGTYVLTATDGTMAWSSYPPTDECFVPCPPESGDWVLGSESGTFTYTEVQDCP